MKEFLEWIGLKEKLHNQKHHPPLVSQGNIWWASVGKNIDYRRLSSKLGTLDDEDFTRVKDGFHSLYK